MKHKLFCSILAFCLILSVSSAVYAADETGALAIYDDTNTFVQYVNTFDEANELIKEYEQFRNYTIVLQDDVSTELKTQNYGTVACGIDLLCNLDLNGHALTINGNVTGTLLMVSGINVSNKGTVISNGTIILTFTAPSPTSQGSITLPQFTAGILLSNDECAIKNVSVLTQSTDTVIDAIVYGDGAPSDTSEETAPNSIDNVSINVTGNAFKFQEAIKGDTKIVINSGSFRGLDSTSLPTNLTINEESKSIADLTDVTEGTTVITSTNTTAIIVDDGNAYLYDTLQDAVNAASRRADDSGNVEIQLLKQPEDGTVELPSDVSAEDITISKLGDDSDINLGGIIMTDSNDNKVTVGDDGKLETIIAVESVTLDKTSLDLYVGNTAELNATVKPENAADKIVTWSSSDPTVATVDTNGNVKALKPGTTTITATAGGKSATCTVTVSYPVNIPDTYDIDLIVGEGGEAKTSLTNASAGSTITVTVTPDEGYEFDYITVDGERIDGTTFTMPEHDVTVRVYFTDGSVEMPFVDVNTGDWFYDEVAYVYANGLMDGTSTTTFEPNANMTRAMVWAILARIDGETVTGAAWATDARAWAMAEGVSDGTDPNGLVTREQFATMLYRYAVAKGYDVSIGESTNILSYADFASISEYAIPAMQWACGSGIVTGVTDSTLAPQGTATRAQCAAMLMRFVEL